MKKWKTLGIWVAFIVCFVLLYQLSSPLPLPRQDFAALEADLAAGEVASIRIHNNEITVERYSGTRYVTLGVVTEAFSRELSDAGVWIEWGPESNTLRTLLLVGVPLVLILGLFGYFVKKGSGGNTGILELRKSRARLLTGRVDVTFADVGGCAEAKEQLSDIVAFLKDPAPFGRAGVRLPRGVLLEGPPGCGKTLLARAVAGETDAKFYWVSASEFVELFVGVGAARVRDMFETAAKNAPAVIFVDELDAVGRKRGSGIGAGHDEREQTLNQILVCMDGFEAAERVVVMAATNRSDVLDPALLRPGRFDRRIAIGELSRVQRREVLRIHTRAMSLAPDVSLEALAEKTAGRSGAALESLVNEAGLLAVRRARVAGQESVTVTPADLVAALEAGRDGERRFDAVDALLVEATSQLAQATAKARVRITLPGPTVVEGELVWADANFVKVRPFGEGEALVLGKARIVSIQALDGTEQAPDVAPDRLAGHQPDLA